MRPVFRNLVEHTNPDAAVIPGHPEKRRFPRIRPLPLIRRFSRLSLLGKFSFVSFVLIGALGVLLAWGIQEHLEQNALHQEAWSAADQVSLVLEPQLTVGDFAGPIPAARYAQIDALVRQTLLHNHIVRVKLWKRDGTVLYSDEPSVVNQRFPVEDDLDEAFDGKMEMDVSSLTSVENVAERPRYNRLMEVYIPLHLPGADGIAGVCEIYHDLSVVEPGIEDMRRFVWASMSAGFLVLFGSLFTLVRNASRDLRQGSVENARLYTEANERVLELQAAEDALRESEEHFRLLFASNPLPMWLYDLSTLRFLEVNDAALLKYGYTCDEFMEMTVAEIGVPGESTSLPEHLGDHARSVQVRHRLKDGSIIDVQVTSHALEFRGSRTMLVVAEDITERKRSQERVQLQLQRLAALRSIDMAITASVDLRVTLAVVLEKVTAQLRVDAADVLLLNPHSLMLECAAGVGFRSNAPGGRNLRMGEGYAGRAALERRILGVPDLQDARDFVRTDLATGNGFRAYYAAPLIAKGHVQGVLEVFHRGPLDPDSEWLAFFEALAGQTAIAIDNATLFEDLQRSNVDLALAYDTTLEGWSRALDLRDRETEGHTQRVTEMTLRLARAMRVGEAEMVQLRRGALLHDIGKMGIPDAILLKPGPLTDEEWQIMRRHPEYAYELLSPIPFLRPALDIPYCHHEKWDGTGYPRGLKGEQIPLAARIFAVVDVWDALRSDRPYRPAWSEARVRDHIASLSGTHFDPRVVEAFLSQEPWVENRQEAVARG